MDLLDSPESLPCIGYGTLLEPSWDPPAQAGSCACRFCGGAGGETSHKPLAVTSDPDAPLCLANQPNLHMVRAA